MENIDYRDILIIRRLKRIKYILMICSGKGGVGKSLISAATALLLAKKGYSTGLLDLDLHGPSSTIIFDLHDFPKEEKEGLIPPIRSGVKIMSLDLFVRGKPLPVKGEEKKELIKEILALTYFGDLDYLIVDMPPETGEVLLNSIQYLRGERGSILVITPSILAIRVVRRVAEILRDMKVNFVGLIENMIKEGKGDGLYRFDIDNEIEKLVEEYGVPYLGKLPYDELAAYAADHGRLDILMETKFFKSLGKILEYIFW